MSDASQDTILIVEPDASLLALLTAHFAASQDFSFYTAATGQEALTAALKHRPKLILLETQLPDKAGLAVLRELRQHPRTQHIPVIFLAGGTEIFLQNQILAEGADDFVQKPFDVAELTLRIRNLLRRSHAEETIHPISRLPTGASIDLAIEKMKAGAVQIWLSIEHFDAFKDVYGFVTANEVLSYVSNVISDAVTELGTGEDFIGHRNEAKFVILTQAQAASRIAEQLQTRLDAQLPQFYSFMEREQGYVEVPDGSGGQARKPLMRLQTEMIPA